MFYLLNKSKGESSFSSIRKFSKKINAKKVGHTGTLDPLATGLLLVATEDDTKLIQFICHEDKTYRTLIQFGQQTDTFDSEGTIINTSKYKINDHDINKIKSWLENQKFQIPPIYSAKKINGVKSYDLARKGKEVSLKPQEIKIIDSKIIEFNYESQTLWLELKVSKGTYIRSIVNDLGIFLNSYAYMKELVRTAIGNLSLDNLEENEYTKIDSKMLFNIPFFEPNEKQTKDLINGKIIKNDKGLLNGDYLLINKKIIWGIITLKNEYIKVKKIFGNKIKELKYG
ncbi:tRNA pseudouridine(55) synthase TruB [Mycoplasma tauri]|uniref:tRNA pseudouridine(55) synthase TruB n=1 Tax=Mycoplasma tauri TaxID=547987 RepID=UPI00196819E8|nr:tRNA pseudouridine(55) synthase TruB [Mycoplasma tauri]QSB07562.1 tRNA pseudouridine(55) synthase TruB [Mycoplasma tauri]